MLEEIDPLWEEQYFPPSLCWRTVAVRGRKVFFLQHVLEESHVPSTRVGRKLVAVGGKLVRVGGKFGNTFFVLKNRKNKK